MDVANVILVVEDQVMLRNLVCEFLALEGYEVLSAADGREAVALSRTHQGCIDLFLTDIEMPQLGGVGAFQIISPERPDMRVLFMSGGTVQSELPEPWPFLSKPFRPSDLLEKVRQVLLNMDSAVGKRRAVILVVDHDQVRKQRTKNILVDNGYEVLMADSVEDAGVVSLRTERIDLIVSEVMFSGDSGVQLAEREASDRNIDTLLISHFHPDLLNKVAGFSTHAAFLANPFTPEELLTRVLHLLKTSIDRITAL